jgi:methionyl-tRNA formyltransferase
MKQYKVILAGSVNSSRRVIEKLIEHDIELVGILGLDPDVSKNVSGFVDLKLLSQSNNIDFKYFRQINSQEVIDFLKEKSPDFLFVIGLSQIVKKEVLNISKVANIGFHPTLLPEGRGRGALAWISLGKVKGASTFFEIDEGMDSGHIWVQKPLEVGEGATSNEILQDILLKIDLAMNEVLPQMKIGNYITSPQEESKATYLGKRKPKDGIINWNFNAEEILKLVNAITHPLPGAYTYLGNKKLIVWKAKLSKAKHIGIPGRIVLSSENDGIYVQTGNDILILTDYEGVSYSELVVGTDLGLDFEKEYFKLLKRIEKLEQN